MLTHDLYQSLHKRQKLINAITKHEVLRFVAGYPLPPDLNLRAKSVKSALAALGENAVVATLRLDSFRAHFILQDEDYLLESLEHALDRKRKADAMN